MGLCYTGCFRLTYTPKGQTLLKTVSVEMVSQKKWVTKSELPSSSDILALSAQHAHYQIGFGKIILLRPNVILYKIGTRFPNTERKIPNWLINKVGEKPIIYDRLANASRLSLMQKYVAHHGFFKAKVSIIDTNRKGLLPRKMTNLVYRIDLNQPTRIEKVVYRCKDEDVNSIIQSTLQKAEVKAGDIYNEDKISAERDRIYNELKNKGYYFYTKNAFSVWVDTLNTSKPCTAILYIDIQDTEERLSPWLYDSVKVYIRDYRGSLVNHEFHPSRRLRKTLSKHSDTSIVNLYKKWQPYRKYAADFHNLDYFGFISERDTIEAIRLRVKRDADSVLSVISPAFAKFWQNTTDTLYAPVPKQARKEILGKLRLDANSVDDEMYKNLSKRKKKRLKKGKTIVADPLNNTEREAMINLYSFWLWQRSFLHKHHLLNQKYPQWRSYEPASIEARAVFMEGILRSKVPLFKKEYDRKMFQDTLRVDNLILIGHNHRIKLDLLREKISFPHNQPYSIEQKNLIQGRLDLLNMFRSVKINFEKSKKPQYLNVIVDLTLHHRNEYQYRPYINSRNSNNANNSNANNIDLGNGLIFRNRNTFRRAERLEFNINFYTALNRAAQQDPTKNPLRSSNLEFSAQMVMPRVFGRHLIDPIINTFRKKDNRSNLFLNPYTTLNAKLIFESRQNYIRTRITGIVNYEWLHHRFARSSFSPIVMSYVNPKLYANFYTDLNFAAQNLYPTDTLRQINYKQQVFLDFSPTILTAVRYTYTYNNYTSGVNRKVAYFFSATIEAGNNLAHWIDTYQIKKDSSKTDLRVADRLFFSQYLKTSVEFRWYIPIYEKFIFAMRTAGGWAMPYNRSYFIPYDQRFFLGGSNSLRGWAPRTVGPGSAGTVNTPFIDQGGEIMIETNIEIRRKLFEAGGIFYGGLFFDIGNTWYNPVNKQKSPTPVRSEAVFDTHRFMQELASDVGFGLRMDFSFLLIRLDLAYRVTDPAEPVGSRYVLDKRLSQTFKRKPRGLSRQSWGPQFNLGLGLPF
ncbi:MAG: outer membrane protein assembly factor [Bacteroidia bacterium]|nr:outer membrane protein assembly factor [Bacteroidia bacterium]MDW8347850.1 BamA/TamA family outer membrane protein [Bacteroidia bacterium]